MRYRQSFPWGALLVGLLIGIVGGVIYAWFLNPVTFVNIAPDRLSDEDKALYILIVAEAYSAEGDSARAAARLELLDLRDNGEAVAAQADAAFLRGEPPEIVRALTTLAEALGKQPLAAEVFSGTQAGPSTASTLSRPAAEPTQSPTAEQVLTPQPGPTLPPAPTLLIAPDTQFNLSVRSVECPDTGEDGQLEVLVTDEFGGGIPGIEIRVQWDTGQDTFFTGLKPEISPGFADFQIEPDQRYSITLIGLSEPVVGIEAARCATQSGQSIPPQIRLVFTPADGN
jgi:hypothetical protein